MLPETLPPEKEVRTETLDGARRFLETDFQTSFINTTLDKLKIQPDGHVGVEGRRIPVTQSFMESAAKEIGMGLNYAYDIQPELFIYNFEQRMAKQSHAVMVCLNRGTAINIADAKYRPAHTLDVLDGLTLSEKFWKFQQALISDRGVEINYVNIDPDSNVNPEPGDEIEVGIRISNSETGYRGLKASLLSYRLVCSNGAVLADQLGTARWNYDNRVTYWTSLEKFQKDLHKLEALQERVKSLYEGIIERPLLDREFVQLWRRLRNGLEPSTVDDILQVDPDERREVQNLVRARQTTQAPEPTSWRVYGLHNRITQAAQRFNFQQRRRLEQIGGDLLSRVSLN